MRPAPIRLLRSPQWLHVPPTTCAAHRHRSRETEAVVSTVPQNLPSHPASRRSPAFTRKTFIIVWDALAAGIHATRAFRAASKAGDGARILFAETVRVTRHIDYWLAGTGCPYRIGGRCLSAPAAGAGCRTILSP